MLSRITMLTILLAVPLSLPAQSKAKGPDITGIWRVDAGADVKDGPREVIIRADSSASWGKEVVRWRVKDGKIWIALGGEWEIYKLKATATSITLSDGDLTKPVTLKKVGPATPRPTGVKVPHDPDA